MYNRRVAFNPPNPNQARRSASGSSGLKGYAQAERMMQIAFVLPCGLAIGWAAGWWIDSHFHQHWATVTGVILGILGGMVSAVRLALVAGSKGPQ